MERLLADASKLSGKKYDISNLNDVFEAIHVIQQQLGITGTTSLEAETTIQGSALGMKAAWQNLIVGIADENANLEQLIDNFVECASSAMSNLLPRITQAISGMGDLIVGLGGVIVENLPAIIQSIGSMMSTIASSVGQSLPMIMDVASQLVGGLVDFISSNASSFITKGAELIDKLGEGLKQNMPTFISKGLDVIQGFADFLTANVPTLVQSGCEFIRNLVKGLMDALPELISRVPQLITQFANVINNNAPTIIMQGVGLIKDIIVGLIKAIPTLIASIPQIIEAIVAVWSAFNWIDLGKNAIQFLGNGIKGMIGFAKTAIGNIKDGIVNTIKNLPSNLMTIGRNGITSLGSAISGAVGSVLSACRGVASNAISALRSGLSPGNLLSIGRNMIQGLWNGISNMTGWILDKIGGFSKGVLKAIKSHFGIHSPSRVMRDEVGKYLAEGIGVGFVDEMDNVSKAMNEAIPMEYDTSVVSAHTSALGGNLATYQTNTSATQTIDRNALKGAIIDALNEGLFKVELDGRELGRVVRTYA